jgi:WD40 repeat protein
MTDNHTQDMSVEHKTTLKAFARALTREAHVLTQQPDLLWQQLYNRLQWASEPVGRMLVPELTRRCKPGAEPWIKNRTPPRESESLIRTLSGHALYVNACAISPDDSFIVSASRDKTLKVWDVATGRERATLTGHTSGIRACAISPTSSFIVSASWDKTLKVWDAATGNEQVNLAGHNSWISDFAISSDGSWIVSASDDKTLKVWDSATGRERATLPLLGSGDCLALHPWLPFVAYGDQLGMMNMVDLIGIEYRSLVVTSVDRGSGPSLRCPSCRHTFQLEDGWLGQVITCPQQGCSIRLKINRFVIQRADKRY